jgi:hypothetical protein
MGKRNQHAIPVDGAAADEVVTSAPTKPITEVSSGFYSLHFLAIKYLVVKDVFMLSFLISAGASGLEATAIAKKSHKDLDKERR